MLSLTVFFTVIIATLVSIQPAQCKRQDSNLQNILDTLQLLLETNQRQPAQSQDVFKLDSDSSRSLDAEENSAYGNLRSHEVQELIRLADKESRGDRKKRVEYNLDYNVYSSEEQWVDRLGDLLNLFLNKNKRSRSKLVPNDLLGLPRKQVIEGGENLNDLDSYTNIYFLLNPEALGKSKNQNILNDLINNLGKSRQEAKQRKQIKKLYNERYPIRYMLGRRRIDDDLISSEHRQKRSRADNSARGGGGGGVARTPIPYIRHRGDIYEKDD